MSISSEIDRIKSAKEELKTVITSKGVKVPQEASLDTYSTYVNQIKSLDFYKFDFTASSWESNSYTTSSFNKYMKSFSLPSNMNSDSNIVSYIQVPYNSTNFDNNELDACYYWSEIEITSSNVVFYSSSNININFSIIVYYE